MTPFHVQCTTCRRTLIVRRESAIGQILPCPKCGSMVLIEPPPGGAKSAAGEAASRGKTKTLDAQHRSALEDANVDAILAVPDPQAADTVPDPDLQQLDQRRVTPAVVAPALITTPTDAGKDWVSNETQLLRRWLMIGATSVAGVILLIVVIGVWISSSNQKSVAKDQSGKDQSGKKQSGQKQGTEKNLATRAGQTAGTPAAESSDAAGDMNAGANSGDEASASENGVTTGADDPAGSADDTSGTDAAAATSAAAAASGTADNADPGAAVTAPSESAPAQHSGPAADAEHPNADGPAGEAPTGETTATDAEPSVLTAQEALREFEGFLEDSTFEDRALRTQSAYDLIPLPATNPDLSAALPRPTRRDVNVERELKLRIPAVDFRDLPLSKFVQFVADFSNIPVTIEPYALLSLDLDASSPVNVTAAGRTLGEVLQAGLEPLKLRYQIAGKHLIIVASSTSGESLEEREYNVFDIVANDATEAQGLVEIITSLIAPESWRERGGPATITLVNGSLQVSSTPEVHYEILMLCERLRIARGQRPQTDVADYLKEQTPRVALALTKLGQPITANYNSPARLTEILDYLATTAEMQILVDWRSLDEVGHSPESLAKLEVTEQSLSQALQTLLTPMELTFRVIDDHTLQITAGKAALLRSDVELFPVATLAAKDGGQKVLEGVRTILGESFAGQRGPLGLRLDGRSSTLIVAAPQHQIAAIARLIERLNAESLPAEPAAEAEVTEDAAAAE